MEQAMKQISMSLRRARPRARRKKLTCGECRRRKQKCDRKEPCCHCSRRFPVPVCDYREAPELKTTRSPAPQSPALRQACDESPLRRLEEDNGESWDSKRSEQLLSSALAASLVEQAATLAIHSAQYSNVLLRFYVETHSHQTSLLALEHANPYQREFIPYSAQTPLLSQISTYTGACLLNRIKQLDRRLMITTKGQAIQLLNRTLTSETSAPSDEVIAGVIALVSTDLCHGDLEHLRLHICGLREMIRFRGGESSLGMNGLIAKLAAACDVVGSLTLELPALLVGESSFGLGDDLHAFQRQLCYDTPLVPSTGSFKKRARQLGLEEATASILDDVQFLVETVLSLPPAPPPPELAKLKSLSGWMHDRVSSVQLRDPPPADGETERNGYRIHRSVQLAALIFCRAIQSRMKFSKVCSQETALEVLENIRKVPLGTWKGLLGVLHWLLTAVAPSIRGMDQTMHSRSMLMLATLHIGLGDWAVAICASRRILRLQVWLAGGETGHTVD